MAGIGYSHEPGAIVSLDLETERRLIESGQAEPVRSTAKKSTPRKQADD